MLKTFIFYLLLLVSIPLLQAQNPNTCRVVFTVNMQQQDVSDEGIHIVGNFFNRTDLKMESIGNDLYQYVLRVTRGDSLVYNFKNGLSQREVLFNGADCLAPGSSGNRLLVVPDTDSLQVPIACFGSCQDCELNTSGTVRVIINVDMSEQEVPAEGIFVRGNFFNGTPEPMKEEENNIWSYIVRVNVGDTLTYQFGKGIFESEIISDEDGCVQLGIPNTRMVLVPNDNPFFPLTVCFGSCTSCQTTNTVNVIKEQQIQLTPNVTDNQTQLRWSNADNQAFQIKLYTSSGQLLKQYNNVQQSPFLLDDLPVNSGLYIVTIQNKKGEQGTLKLLIK